MCFYLANKYCDLEVQCHCHTGVCTLFYTLLFVYCFLNFAPNVTHLWAQVSKLIKLRFKVLSPTVPSIPIKASHLHVKVKNKVQLVANMPNFQNLVTDEISTHTHTHTHTETHSARGLHVCWVI